jgi:hypothetical protein
VAKEKADKALDAFRAAMRKVPDDVRDDLLKRMKEALTADQVKQFTEALDRGPPDRRPFGPGRRPGGFDGGPDGFDGRPFGGEARGGGGCRGR